jgi:hypothetical protein
LTTLCFKLLETMFNFKNKNYYSTYFVAKLVFSTIFYIPIAKLVYVRNAFFLIYLDARLLNKHAWELGNCNCWNTIPLIIIECFL